MKKVNGDKARLTHILIAIDEILNYLIIMILMHL